MGRATQFFDYLKRNPKDLDTEFIKFNYTHFKITPELKKLRRKLKLYKQQDELTLF